MSDALFVPALIACAIAAGLLVRNSRIFAWGAPLLLTGLFLHVVAFGQVDIYLFTWIKVFSLIIGVMWINAMRFTRFGSSHIGRKGIWFILAANIFEAGLTDVISGYWVNGLCALALIASQASWREVSIATVTTRDLEWQLGCSWIVGYSLWNFAFVYRYYSEHFSDHIAIVGVPLLWLLVAPRVWFQQRGYILSLYALAIIVFEAGYKLPWPEPVGSFSPTVYWALCTAAWVATLLHVCQRFGPLLRGRQRIAG